MKIFLQTFIEFFQKKVPFFALQFVLTWLFLRLLGFFRLGLLYKLGLSFLFFLLLWWVWDHLVEKITNNIFFQYYLFLGYKIVDFCLQFRGGIYILASWLSLCPFLPYLFSNRNFDFVPVKNLEIPEFFYPSMDVTALILCFFTFFYKINASVILPQIHLGIVRECMKLKKGLRWLDLLGFLFVYLVRRSSQDKDTMIENKLEVFTKNSYFLHFPVPKKYFDQWSEINANVLRLVCADYGLTRHTENFELYWKRKGEALTLDVLKKEVNLIFASAAKEAMELNYRWFIGFTYTFYSGLFFLFFVFNYTQLTILYFIILNS